MLVDPFCRNGLVMPGLREQRHGALRALAPGQVRARRSGLLSRSFLSARLGCCYGGGGEVLPGRSSAEGGIEEFPEFRETARSSLASRSASSAFAAPSCAPAPPARRCAPRAPRSPAPAARSARHGGIQRHGRHSPRSRRHVLRTGLARSPAAWMLAGELAGRPVESGEITIARSPSQRRRSSPPDD